MFAKGADVLPMINSIGFFVNRWEKYFPIGKTFQAVLSFFQKIFKEIVSVANRPGLSIS